jgi:hypothetical protein
VGSRCRRRIRSQTRIHAGGDSRCIPSWASYMASNRRGRARSRDHNRVPKSVGIVRRFRDSSHRPGSRRRPRNLAPSIRRGRMRRHTARHTCRNSRPAHNGPLRRHGRCNTDRCNMDRHSQNRQDRPLGSRRWRAPLARARQACVSSFSPPKRPGSLAGRLEECGEAPAQSGRYKWYRRHNRQNPTNRRASRSRPRRAGCSMLDVASTRRSSLGLRGCICYNPRPSSHRTHATALLAEPLRYHS